MTSVTIADLGPQFSWGSRVAGMTRDNIHDPALRAELKALFEARGLIVFDCAEPSSKMHVELSRIFGPLKDHPTKTTARADHLEPGVIERHNAPRADLPHLHGLTEVDGRLVTSYLPWHFDHTYNDELNYAGMLRPMQIAPERGRTGFADGVELYQALDPDLVARIEERNAIYTLDVRLTQMRFGRTFKTFGDEANTVDMVAEAGTFPRAMHPMVWTRPSGEKVAHFCGFGAEGIEHHEDPEGDALLHEAMRQLNERVNPYWHTWKLTDMLIWDNPRMLHAVEGCDPQYERRMHRTTLKGDYGLGYFEHGKKVGEVSREMAPLNLP